MYVWIDNWKVGFQSLKLKQLSNTIKEEESGIKLIRLDIYEAYFSQFIFLNLRFFHLFNILHNLFPGVLKKLSPKKNLMGSAISRYSFASSLFALFVMPHSLK